MIKHDTIIIQSVTKAITKNKAQQLSNNNKEIFICRGFGFFSLHTHFESIWKQNRYNCFWNLEVGAQNKEGYFSYDGGRKINWNHWWCMSISKRVQNLSNSEKSINARWAFSSWWEKYKFGQFYTKNYLKRNIFFCVNLLFLCK